MNKTLRILHSALMLRPATGIINQMNFENDAAKQEMLNWDARIFSPYKGDDDSIFVNCQLDDEIESKSVLKRLNNWISFRVKYYSWLKEQSHSYDALVLRHSVADPLQYFFICNIKKPILLVHHTLELYELRLNKGFLAWCKIFAEKIFGALSIKAAAGIIGVTEEIAIHEKSRANTPEKPSCIYPNGITYLVNSDLDFNTFDGEVPCIVFVASYFFPWHGLDMLLDNIKKSELQFQLHLIGTLSPKDLECAKSDNRVVIHGQLSAKDILKISKKCRLGLSSFALHRNSMNEACTLKTREYLMSGLAVYSGHKDVFPDDFSYYRVGPPCIESIIEFHKELSDASKLCVSTESEKYISKRMLVADLNKWISSRIDQSLIAVP